MNSTINISLLLYKTLPQINLPVVAECVHYSPGFYILTYSLKDPSDLGDPEGNKAMGFFL